MNDFHDLCDTYLGRAPLDMVSRTVCISDTPGGRFEVYNSVPSVTHS
jgi:hypothetical protein